MKTSSYTSESVHQRCPKRFYYRYLCETDDGATEKEKAQARYFKGIYGLNEAIGHVVHEEIRHRIKQILDGKASIPEKMAANTKASQHLMALAEEGAIAEIMNGVNTEEQIRVMASDVDVWVMRAMESLSSFYDPRNDQAEIENLHHVETSKGKRRLKIDLLLKKGRKWVIVDWKTKDEPTKDDVHQLRLYLEFIRSTRSVGFNDLIGLIVCVKSGRIKRVNLGPLDEEAYMTSKDAQWGTRQGDSPASRHHENESVPVEDRYPTHSGPWCAACAFFPICSARGEIKPSEKNLKNALLSGSLQVRCNYRDLLPDHKRSRKGLSKN